MSDLYSLLQGDNQHEEEEERSPLDGVMGETRAPDEVAAERSVAARVGAPPAAVRAYPDLYGRRAEAQRTQEATEDNPRLRAWLAQPDNYAVARDDVENLSVFERLWRGYQAPASSAGERLLRDLNRANPTTAWFEMLRPRRQGAGGDWLGNEQARQGDLDVEYGNLAYRRRRLEADGGFSAEDQARLDELASREGQEDWGPFIIGPTRRLIPQIVGSITRGAEQAGVRAGETWENPFPGFAVVPGFRGAPTIVDVTPGDRSVARRVLEGTAATPIMAAASGVSAFGGLVGGYIGFGNEMETGIAYDQMRRADVPADIAAEYADQYGAWASAIEFAGIGTTIKATGLGRLVSRSLFRERILSEARRAAAMRAAGTLALSSAEQGAEEMAQEIAQVIHQDLAEQVAASGDSNVGQAWLAAMTPEAIQRMLMAGYIGAQGGAGMAIVPSGANLAMDLRDAQRAERAAAVLEQMAQAAQGSQTGARLPSALESAVDATADGATVFIDADRFVEHFQSAGANAYAVADELGIGADNLARALSGSGQVNIPVGALTARVLRVPAHAGLAQHVRLSPTDATPAEVQMAGELFKAEVERIVEDAEASAVDGEIGQAVEARMRDLFARAEQEGGYRPEIAARYAKLAAALPRALLARARASGDAAYASRLESQLQTLFGENLDIAGPTRGMEGVGAELTQGAGMPAAARLREFLNDERPWREALQPNDRVIVDGVLADVIRNEGGALVVRDVASGQERVLPANYANIDVAPVEMWGEQAAPAPEIHPTALRFGTEEQARELLALIAAGASAEDVLSSPIFAAVASHVESVQPTVSIKDAQDFDVMNARSYVDPDNGNAIITFTEAVDRLRVRYRSKAGGEVASERRAVVVTGHPGAGKSTFIEALALQYRAAVADADVAKAYTTDYEDGYNTQAVHFESAALRQFAVTPMIAAGDNIIAERVGDNPETINAELDRLTEAGYTVELVHVDVAPDEAVRRMARRFLSGGRFIDPQYYRKVMGKTKPAFAVAIADSRWLGYIEVDANGPLGQHQIATQGGSSAEALSEILRSREPVFSAEEGSGSGARADGGREGQGPGSGRLDQSALPKPPRSLREAVSMTDEEVIAWYNVNVEIRRPSDGSVSLWFKTEDGLARPNVRVSIQSDGLAITSFRGRTSGERYIPNAQDVKKAAQIFVRVAAVTRAYILLNKPERIVFSGATEAHERLYRTMLRLTDFAGYVSQEHEKLNAQAYKATDDVTPVRSAPSTQNSNTIFVIARADVADAVNEQVLTTGFASRFAYNQTERNVGTINKSQTRVRTIRDGRQVDPDGRASGSAASGRAGDGASAGRSDDGVNGGAGSVRPDGSADLEQGARRGSIRYDGFKAGEFGQAMIRMGEASDLSTFLHEFGHLGHLVLESIATDQSAPAEFKQMWETTLSWWGVDQARWDAMTPEQRTEKYELWARSFEAYLMEGKAPSLSLREAFAAFKEWLTRFVYRIVKLDHNLTPEIREVFDRLLATDQEMAEARAAMGSDFSIPRMKNETDEQFAARQASTVEAREAVDAEWRAVTMDKFVRKEKRWWRSERARVRATAEIEVDSDPARRAYEWLAFGEWRPMPVERDDEGNVIAPDPALEKPEELPPMALDPQALIADYGDGVFDSLPVGLRPARPEDVDAALEQAMALKRQARVKQPQRLWAFIKAQGGIRDDGGEIAQALGSARARPGLINNATGISADELALRAWEAGYFGPKPRKADLFQSASPDGGGVDVRTLSYDQKMDLRDARIAEAARDGFVSPIGEMAFHASTSPWMRSGEAPDLARGEGFGLHVGNRGAAAQAAEGHTSVRSKVRPQIYLEHVGVRQGGREISMTDIEDWGAAKNWRVAVSDGLIKGLTPEEMASLRQLLDSLPRGQRAGPAVNEMLRSFGVRLVRYSNRFERRGEESVIVLDPADLRVIRTDGLGSVPDYAAPAARPPSDGGSPGAGGRHPGFELFQDGASPIFVSAVERTVADSKTQRAPGSQWWATISKAPGVKREELQWIGLEDWLRAREGQVTREEVLAFVRENGVRVEETVLGGDSVSPEVQRQLLPLIEERDRVQAAMMDGDNSAAIAAATQDPNVHAAYRAWQDARKANEDLLARALSDENAPAEALDAANRLEDQRRLELRAEARDLRSRLSERISELEGERRQTDTKWSQYTLPGGENYRELLLRLPERGVFDPALVGIERRRLSATQGTLRVTYNGQKVGDFALFDGDATGMGRERTDEEAVSIARQYWEKGNRYDGTKPMDRANFRSSHFDQPNILAHVRFKERVDSEGRRTLFIEEVQSDWHQAGRERGYQNDGSEASKWERDRRVPDAPFKNNAWANLSMKRMIRWAAENGFDQIAWTPGRVQVERFNLGREMRRIYFNPRTRDFTALARSGGAHQESNITDARLEELLGKEGARQVLEAPLNKDGEHEIAANDIVIGGEGMRAFYDRILVNIANDLGKKYGARVGETVIEVARGEPQATSSGRFIESPARTETVHSLPITPEMKEAVIGRGQELFQGQDDLTGDRRPTPRELLDALIDDLRNIRQVYSSDDADAVAAYQNRADQVRWFEARGVDLSATKDEIREQIVAALTREAENPNGVHYDDAAAWFGFGSGDEMIQALRALKPRAEAIEENIERRLEAAYGDPLNDGTVVEAARLAAHVAAQSRKIELELEAIDRATNGRARPVGAAARAYAERQLLSMTVKQIRAYDTFLAGERRAARASLDAFKKGDMQTAQMMKQRQLVSFHLYRLARNAAEEMDKAQRYFQKFDNEGTRRGFLPDGARHLEQIDQILEAIDLKAQPYPRPKARATFQQYLAELQDQGIDTDDIVELDPAFLEAIRRRPFNTLTLEEARGIRDVVQNFEQLGKRWNQVLTDRKNRRLNDVIVELQDRAQTEYPKRAALVPSLSSRSRFEQAADLVMDLHGSMVKAEQLLRFMDGLKANGPWFATFIPAAQRAESAKLERMIVETERFRALIAVYSRKELGRMMLKKEFITAIGDSLTKLQQIGIALNVGNEYNRSALLKGFEWNDQQLQAVLDQLNERDWQFVQGVWDFLESFKQESFDLDYRVRGVRPEEVKATPVQTPWGEMRGGYFPIKFDTARSQRAAKRAAKEAVEQLSGGSYRQTGTKRGRLKQRVGTAGQPLRLDPISIIAEHVEETVHDLTHREFVIDARRLIASERVRQSVRGVMGPWAVKVLDAWIAKIEQPQPQIMSSWERLAGKVKNNATIVNMGLKITTALIQELGVMNAIPRAGIIPTLKQKGITIAVDYPEFLARQAVRLFGAPETLPARFQFIFDRSDFMKRRMETFDRDVKDALASEIGARPGILPQVPKAVQDKMMILSQLMDMAVAGPAWLAGYETALAGKVEGITQGDEQAAIEHADSIIRTTQSGGAPKDLSQILANDNQFWRLTTMFMSWANTFYNQMFVEQIPGVASGKISAPRFAANMLFIWFAPALITMWFYGRTDEQDGEDEDERNKRAILETLIYPLQTIPILRDSLNAYVTGYGHQFTPVQAALEAPVKLARAADRGDSEEVIKQVVMVAGYLRGLPSRQLWITGEGVTDIATGEEDVTEDPLDSARELLVRDTR